MYKHILIPTDGSPQSAKAITGAVELAKAIGAKVTGLFAAPPATPIFYRDHLPAGFGTMEDHKRIIEDSAAATSTSSPRPRNRPAFHARS